MGSMSCFSASAKSAANDAYDAAEMAKQKEHAALMQAQTARAMAQQSAVSADNATRKVRECI